jgi:phage terminase large subunit
MLDYQIIVTPRSINIKKEFNNYTWSDKKSGSAIDDFNHAIDGIRYVVYYLHKMQNNKGYKIQ